MDSIPSFGSDNHATVHPRFLEILSEVNKGQVPSYGTDGWSQKVTQSFRREFGENVESFLVFNGTAANVLSLRAMVRHHQSIFCSDISHLMNDECGAPEVVGGVKLIPVPSTDGKITVPALDELWIRRGDQHYAQTQGISLTQPTEVGTVYSVEELNALIRWAKSKKIFVHLDGARLANAAIALQKSFREFTSGLGVDIISFGGSKNGLMLGEAVVICNPVLAQDFKYIRKQCLQLPSKSRYIAAQFLAYLDEGLWQTLAQNSIERARELHLAIKSIPGVDVVFPVQSNAVFPRIPKAWVKPLREKYFFYVWDEKQTLCRWMTSWDTTSEDVQGFAREIQNLSRVSIKI